ncbi:hypothetical protein GALL_500970 [mine drainage metagenome]|uniref:Uncharacterized protein n=1 Tax=mine drainage metagenome TaxID=410659 RepID=A0A1J5P9P1_9ZZZZ
MDVFNVTVKHGFDGLRVVQHTVIGRLSQGQYARLDLMDIQVRQVLLDQEIGLDFGLDRGRFELAFRNRPDDAKVVAGRLQKHRNSTGHDNGVKYRLVAIAVNNNHIVGCHRVMPDHFVAGTCAVSDKKTMVSIENSCRIALALANRSVMVEQLTQLFNRIADISAQHVFAIKLVVHLPNRALQKCNTS